MPTITAHITAVYGPRPVQTKHGWKEKFDVQTDYREPGFHGGTFETWSAFAASLCRIAERDKKAVRLTYKDAPKWASEIVDVEFIESQVA
jgi:hypothetical protein